jgi:F-type H+-transporting ATPase subunit b
MDIISSVSSLLENFGVNWVSFLGQLTTFVLLLALLRLVLYKPMLQMLEERKTRIAQGLKDAEEAAKARAESEQQAVERLKEATAKAESLLEESRKAAERLKSEVMSQTQVEIERVKQSQQEQLAQMKAEMLRDVKSEVADLVVTTTKKVLGEELSGADQQKLAERAVKELQ